jgi:hypothetical protein
MKKHVALLCGIIVALIVMSTSVTAQDAVTTNLDTHKSTFIGLGAGLVISSGYKNALEASHPDWDISGGVGWVYLDLDLGIRASKGIYVVPKLGFLATFIQYGQDPLASKQATLILLPGVGGRYEVSPKPSTLFFTGDLSLVVPSTDLESPKLESGGMSFGGSIGYTFDHQIEMALLYRYVPVKATTEVSGDIWGGSTTTEGESTNFGGIGFVVRKMWSF